MFNLNNKKALVTGASGGIGSAIARTLHSQGAEVVISGTRLQPLEELANELKTRVHIKTCNLSDQIETENLIDEVEKLVHNIDIVVCNAGITKDGSILRMKNEDFTDVINVNLFSCFIINKSAIKKMVKNKAGRIINISSIVALMGNPGQANYCASKAGMIGMTKSMANEVASRNITINCVAPGFIDTAMTEILKPELKDKLINNIPCNRMGTAQEVANCVTFLASDEASYITGQTIHVNGGMIMV